MIDLTDEKANNITVKGYSLKDIESRLIKNFLDIIILVELKKKSSLSGCDIIAFVNGKFGEMLSPGTAYSTLYGIERKGLIKGISDGRKTAFKLTNEGEETTTRIMKDFNGEMTSFIKKFVML